MRGADRNKINELRASYVATGSVTVRNQLVEQYMPLVKEIARNLIQRLPDEVQLDDLVQAGALGLMQAVERFEPERGLQFATLASRRVWGSMMDELRDFHDWAPRVARHRTKIVMEAAATFEAAHGRRPTRDELQREMQLPADEFHRVVGDQVRCLVPMSSVTIKDEDGENVPLTSVLRDKRSGTNGIRSEARDLIVNILRDFTLTDALFVRLYYLESETLKQVGQTLGFRSESSMCHHHKQLLTRLRGRYAPEVLRQLAGRAA